MNFRPTPLDTSVPVDLSVEAEFRLGETVVRPSLLEVSRAGKAATLEPRVMQVLTVLARRPGSVTSRDELAATCWGGRIVGEDALQRTIAKVRHVAEVDAGGDFFVETVPRVGYRLVLRGVPADAGGDLPARPAWRRRPALIAAIAIGILLAAGALGWRALTTFEPAPSLRLAGFTALGSDVPPSVPAKVESEVRSGFGAESALLVRDGSSDYLLRGAVQRYDAAYRYTFRLTDARDGTEVWSGTRDFPIEETEAPGWAAETAVIIVRCGLTAAAGHHARLSAHAVKLYVQFCEHSYTFPRSYERAMDSARRLTVEVPDFANGWAALASAAADTVVHLPDSPQTAPIIAEGEAAAARALKLDRRNAMAFDAQAMLKPGTALVEKEALHRKAIAARPMDCSCERLHYAYFLMAVGRPREAAEQFGRSADIRPTQAGARYNQGAAYLAAGDLERGRAVFERITAVTADPAMETRIQGALAEASGRWAEVADGVSPWLPPERRDAMIAGYKAIAAGDPAGKAAAVGGLLRNPPRPRSPRSQPVLLAQLGARDAALAALAAEDAYSGREGPSSTRFDPGLRPLRDDPAYVRQLEANGLIDFWRKTKTRPDLCGEPTPAAFCAKI